MVRVLLLEQTLITSLQYGIADSPLRVPSPLNEEPPHRRGTTAVRLFFHFTFKSATRHCPVQASCAATFCFCAPSADWATNTLHSAPAPPHSNSLHRVVARLACCCPAWVPPHALAGALYLRSSPGGSGAFDVYSRLLSGAGHRKHRLDILLKKLEQGEPRVEPKLLLKSTVTRRKKIRSKTAGRGQQITDGGYGTSSFGFLNVVNTAHTQMRRLPA